jgi:AraC-like DNA-binding protein
MSVSPLQPRITNCYRSEDIRLTDYRCCGSTRGPASTEAASTYEVVFVRRGAFALWTHKRERLVTPNEMLLLAPGATYSASHPVAGGDDCTIVSCSAELLEPFFRGRETLRTAPASPHIFRAHLSAFDLSASCNTSALEVQERLADLVVQSLEAFDGSIERRAGEATPTQRRSVRRAQEVISSRYWEPLPLRVIARLVGSSPFHLSRLFRRVTGLSMHRYQTRLRLRAAMDRILEGAPDLGSLALDLGFSSHSHFTSAFRSEFGVPPAALRHDAGAVRRARRALGRARR